VTDAHGQHAEAVAFAGAEVEGLQHLLGACVEKADQAVGAVYNAVGSETAAVESARNALESVAHIRDTIRELMGSAEVAIQELRRYRGGF
jgi:hypothetical protein